VNLTWLEKLDRRWLFLIVGLLTLGPLIRPLGLPLTTSPPVKSFHDAVAAVPDGAIVLMSCDYDPGSKPEVVPMTKTALRQLFDKHCRVVITCLWPGGSGIVDQTLESVVAEYRARGQAPVYGKDYVDLGYKAGNEAVMVLMGMGIASAFPQDQRANRTASLPLMREVRDYSSFALLVNISGGYPGTKEWVQQVNSRFHLPMVSGCTAVSAPEYYPYLQSGQIRGLLGGMAGAAEYEKMRGEKGSATKGMDAQSLTHVFVALCIVLGNVVQWSKRKGAGA
jgi:hypothetical protein